MNAFKIQSVKLLENKKLLVKFENGVEKIYDCNQLLHLDVFQLLKNDAFSNLSKLMRVGTTYHGTTIWI